MTKLTLKSISMVINYLMLLTLISCTSYEQTNEKKAPSGDTPHVSYPSGKNTSLLNSDTFSTPRIAISVSGPPVWGEFEASWHDCPQGKVAIGFSLAVEPKLGGGHDDTSVNSISIYCGFINSRQESDYTKVTPNSGWWGSTTMGPIFCDKGKAFYGYKVIYEPPQSDGDDTGMNGLHMVCRSPNDWQKSDDWKIIEAHWPIKESDFAVCPYNTFISGVISAVEPKQGKGDDTALNSVKFSCSRYDK